ncbi:acyl-CoA dehydrogenase family protein [Streptomyces sp. ISL-11]|uniref:acyl-CoA dehydrogenase family protein n=1 Tax=Streptomyces sp. ISL-11 TaxID=2819174 RepID=UPI001BEBCEBB|nr:acyl-CoA dehydrogenase family protein [Streptomyces sp. ISL-11]MBT2383914.1 acyl-CoA dehydrogenase family protein [Streptomyces sp. ISL-11]
MDLAPTPDQRAYRDEIRALLDTDEVRAETAAIRTRPGTEGGLLDIYRKLGARGLLAPNWPPEYGGSGRGIAEKAILTEELIARGVPDIAHTLSIDIVGLALLLYGTDRQKQRLLPPIARGESVAGVLFSEPEAGSDLSALRTRAERDGDGWRLSGRKVYSAKTQLADFALCAARTTESEVRFHGITVFLVPLRTPGVSVEPMWNIGDERFNEVTLSGIRVTDEDVLGTVDDGWQIIGEVLGLERTGIEFQAKARRWLDAALERAATRGGELTPAEADRLVALDADVRAARLLAWRCVDDLHAGRSDEVRSAMAKYWAGETGREVALAASESAGLDALLAGDDEESTDHGVLEAACREAPGLTLASGTSEVMLTLIASAGLGLLA